MFFPRFISRIPAPPLLAPFLLRTLHTVKIAERVNGASRTVDNELETKMTEVREAEHDLRVLIEMTKEVTDCTTKTVEAQLGLSACFSHLSQTTSSVAPDLAFHQRLQDLMAKNSAGLIEALTYVGTNLYKHTML